MPKKPQKPFGKKSSKPVDTINEQEEILLINAIRNWPTLNKRPWIQYRNYTITLLMLDAGLRVGEACHLRISQLWYADAPVTSIDIPAEETKTHYGRSVPVTARLSNAILSMFDSVWQHGCYKLSHFAFTTKAPSKPISERQVQRIINNAARATIGRKLHPHALRHTFATKLMRKTSARIVQQLLGHKSLQSTQAYTHPNSDDLQKAIGTLNSVTTKQRSLKGPQEDLRNE